MIRNSCGSVRYARNVARDNFTALELIQEGNSCGTRGYTLEELSSLTGITVSRLKKYFNYFAVPSESEFRDLLSVRDKYLEG